jgi:hypothetical protein
MVQVGSSLSEEYFPAQELAERLNEAEASGDIPASTEPTSFSMAQRFRPAVDAAPPPKLDSQRRWRKNAFGALLVLASLVPSALIGLMLWLGAIKAPASGVIVDRYRNDSLEVEQAAMESLEPKTAPPKTQIERPSVVMVVPDTLQAVLGKEIPFSIAINPAGPLPPRAIITVDGMPESSIFSAGRPYGETGWTFRPDEIADNLRLIPSKAGSADLHIELLTAEGVSIASASTHVDITANPRVTLVTRPDESGRIDELLAHGHKMVQVGYLAGARAYFRRAAEAGSADAALALGETYDQNFIDSIGAHGIKPDLAQARTWYERARELGSQEAKSKLGRLVNDAELKPIESHSSSGTDGPAGSVDAAQKAGEAGDQN